MSDASQDATSAWRNVFADESSVGSSRLLVNPRPLGRGMSYPRRVLSARRLPSLVFSGGTQYPWGWEGDRLRTRLLSLPCSSVCKWILKNLKPRGLDWKSRGGEPAASAWPRPMIGGPGSARLASIIAPSAQWPSALPPVEVRVRDSSYFRCHWLERQAVISWTTPSSM